jgi:hypothetical protein
MLDAETSVRSIFSAVAGALDGDAARSAISKPLADLRRDLERLTLDAAPRLMTFSPPPACPGEPWTSTARRLQCRLNDIRLAKTYGDAADVRHVVDLTLDEVRAAALGRYAT